MKKILFLAISLLTFFVSHGQDNPDFYVAPNGVTCMCPNANFGDTGTLTINGQTNTYTKRTRSQLETLISGNPSNASISLTCTSGITDMSYLFYNESSFDLDIGSWDTSNVTEMSFMFRDAVIFNHDINSCQ